MKKIASILLSLICTIFVLGACSGGSFDTTKSVNLISREEGSGTRGAFIELVGVEQKNEAGEKVDYTSVEAVITSSTSVMMGSVSGDKYSIGYISLGSLNDTVKAVKVDGVEASVSNIKDGSYKISRAFNIATKESIQALAEDFINFILSSDGQEIVEQTGYISVSDTAKFTSAKPSGKIVVAGSSSVTPVMEKLKEAYLKINTEANIEIQQSDSTTGMNSAIEGICDIGMASRELKESEISKGIKGTKIAIDGIAVIVNNLNTIESLAVSQIKDIFTGTIKNWNEVIGE